MSLIQYAFFPRSLFDMDYWLRPETLLGTSTLDIFDPFDELDRMLGRNMQWLSVPDVLRQPLLNVQPRVPNKYRILVDCQGYNPDSIKTVVSDDKSKLTVSAKQGEKAEGNEQDFNIREFRRTYNLPPTVETDKLVSFMTFNGRLVIEMPLRREGGDQLPREVDNGQGGKNVEMTFAIPQGIDPACVKVMCKDRDIIVQAEDTKKGEDVDSRFYYYRRSTLPENTNFQELKCRLENNELRICAPIETNMQRQDRFIPVELVNREKQALPQQEKSKQHTEELNPQQQRQVEQ